MSLQEIAVKAFENSLGQPLLQWLAASEKNFEEFSKYFDGGEKSAVQNFYKLNMNSETFLLMSKEALYIALRCDNIKVVKFLKEIGVISEIIRNAIGEVMQEKKDKFIEHKDKLRRHLLGTCCGSGPLLGFVCIVSSTYYALRTFGSGDLDQDLAEHYKNSYGGGYEALEVLCCRSVVGIVAMCAFVTIDVREGFNSVKGHIVGAWNERNKSVECKQIAEKLAKMLNEIEIEEHNAFKTTGQQGRCAF